MALIASNSVPVLSLLGAEVEIGLTTGGPGLQKELIGVAGVECWAELRAAIAEGVPKAGAMRAVFHGTTGCV